MSQILAKLANLEQARILLELPAPSSDEIAKKLNLDKETVYKHTQELHEKGLVLYKRKEQLRTVYSVTELKDTTPANPKFDESLGDEFFDLWDAWFGSDEPYRLLEKLPPWLGRTEPTMRIIARWKLIKDTPDVLPCDAMR